MPTSTQERIEDALQQLVERLVPVNEGESDEAADERYYKAFDSAKSIIENVAPPVIERDEHHVAELVRRRRMSL